MNFFASLPDRARAAGGARNDHVGHLAVLGALLCASVFVASPLFTWLLAAQAYPSYEREFAVVRIGNASVFSEVVRDDADMKRGLSGRALLGSENGMLFVFPEAGYPAIWMKGMLFPIDIVWIAGNRVSSIRENAHPPSAGTPDTALPVYRPDARSTLVLEVPAGFVEANDIRIGTAVSFTAQKDLDADLAAKLLQNRKEQLRYLRSLLAKNELTIDSLRKRTYTGRDVRIEEVLEKNSSYTKYKISYRSDGLTISGVMNIPSYGMPPYPVLIFNHGYVDPAEYTVGRGSKREEDYFARRGYVTVHPDYRGYGDSSPDQAARYDFNVGYTIDVINLLEALKAFHHPALDMSRVGMWGHSMGGGIAERVMVLRNDIKAYVLFAPISSNVSDNLYLVQGKITDVIGQYGADDAAQAFFKSVSPYYYLSSVSAPVMIHHGSADAVVPDYFSETLHRALLHDKKTSLLFIYDGEHHEFIKAWPLAMARSLAFFDQFVKHSRIASRAK